MDTVQKLISGLAIKIENLSEWSGQAVSWLTLIMVLLVFVIVVLRYTFNIGSIELQESTTYLHGMIFLLAASFTLKEDEHVRVDVFYSAMSHRRRAWVDLIGTVLFLFPVCIYIFSMSLDYVLLSWRISEASGEVGGLPALYLLKSLILIMPILMMLQGLAWIIRRVLYLFAGAESPYQAASPEDPSNQIQTDAGV
ncbi:MAG: TRAP transporter small permease subunit [Gammaproteobacteria bacterium]|nr:TRAP transporter small permease subunit [Gammaproteobacteria bacterium]